VFVDVSKDSKERTANNSRATDCYQTLLEYAPTEDRVLPKISANVTLVTLATIVLHGHAVAYSTTTPLYVHKRVGVKHQTTVHALLEVQVQIARIGHVMESIKQITQHVVEKASVSRSTLVVAQLDTIMLIVQDTYV
jgi:hypothetical protein